MPDGNWRAAQRRMGLLLRRLCSGRFGFSGALRRPPRHDQHERAEHQQHQAPGEVDVDAEGARVRPVDETGDGQQNADEGEHKANWPADIESHKVSSFRFSVYQKMMFKMTHAMISTVPTIAGRLYHGWFASLIFGVRE